MSLACSGVTIEETLILCSVECGLKNHYLSFTLLWRVLFALLGEWIKLLYIHGYADDWCSFLNSCFCYFYSFFSACFIWRNYVGSEGDVWEVWGWFSCSFCIKRISICVLPSKSCRAVLSKVEGTILRNLFMLYFLFMFFPWCIKRYSSYVNSLIYFLFHSLLDKTSKLTLQPGWNLVLEQPETVT